MTSRDFLANDLADTDRLGALLARHLPDGTTVALSGTLGSGKTRLVRAVAVACGIAAEEVVSPTFVLCQEYHGRRDLYHLDAYRIRDEDEFEQLGPEEYYDAGGLTFIEWAERVENCLPAEYVAIRIEVIGETARRFRLEAHGASLGRAIERIEAQLRR